MGFWDALLLCGVLASLPGIGSFCMLTFPSPSFHFGDFFFFFGRDFFMLLVLELNFFLVKERS